MGMTPWRYPELLTSLMQHSPFQGEDMQVLAQLIQQQRQALVSPLSYTREQLRHMDLPGITSPLPVDFDFSMLLRSDWQPVINLAMIGWLSEEGQSQVTPHLLTTIRTAEGNLTHPNVVSTPTQRVLDVSVLSDLIRATPRLHVPIPHIPLESIGDTLQAFEMARFSPNPQDLNQRRAPLIKLVRQLLNDKMNIPQAKNLEGTASLGLVTLGFSYVGDHPVTGEELFEPLMMIGLIVHIADPKDFQPKDTTYYRKMGWTELAGFSQNLGDQNVQRLVPEVDELDVVDVCVYGQCLKSTQYVAQFPKNFLEQHLGVPVVN